MWQTATTGRFDDWFAELSEPAEGRDAQVEVAAAIQVLAEFGPRLGRPYVDTLKGSKYANMKELRLSTANMVIRIAFAFDPLQTAILLVAGDKGGVAEKRFYKQLITAAEAEYAAHLRSIKRLLEAKDAERKKKKGR